MTVLLMESLIGVDGRKLYACSYSILELESCPKRARGLKYAPLAERFASKRRALTGHTNIFLSPFHDLFENSIFINGICDCSFFYLH